MVVAFVMVMFVLSVTDAPVLTVNFLKVVAPLIVWLGPPKITLELLLLVVYEPELVQLPWSVIEAFPFARVVPAPMEIFPVTVKLLFTVSLFPEPCIVRFLHVDDTFTVGNLVNVRSPITTSVVDVGIPFDQFAALPQAVLLVPFQLVV